MSMALNFINFFQSCINKLLKEWSITDLFGINPKKVILRLFLVLCILIISLSILKMSLPKISKTKNLISLSVKLKLQSVLLPPKLDKKILSQKLISSKILLNKKNPKFGSKISQDAFILP